MDTNAKEIAVLDPNIREPVNLRTAAEIEAERLAGKASLNSHADKRLTKSGGLDFAVWFYILKLEAKAHGDPSGEISHFDDWRDYYDDDHTPHEAVEEDFNAGADCPTD